MGRRFRDKKSDEYIKYKFIKEKQQNLLAKEGVNPFVLILDHLKTGFNIGKIFRSADAFGCRKIYIIGTKQFNSVVSKGSFKYVPAVFLDTFDEAYQELKAEDYQIFSLNPHTEKTLGEIKLPKKAAFIFGHEQFGEISDLSSYTDIQRVKIPQFGKVESLNVSIAASIVMYEAVRDSN